MTRRPLTDHIPNISQFEWNNQERYIKRLAKKARPKISKKRLKKKRTRG